MEVVGDLRLKASRSFSKRNRLKLKACKRSYGKQLDSKVMDVNRTADVLARKFGDEAHIPFFRKCAWHLSEDQIWTIYERSQDKRSPIGYFISACKSEMRLY